MDIASLTDIESIGLAKITFKRIKDYISCQEYTRVEFAGMPPANSTQSQGTKKVSKSTKRSPKKPDNMAAVESLFPVKELAG